MSKDKPTYTATGRIKARDPIDQHSLPPNMGLIEVIKGCAVGPTAFLAISTPDKARDPIGQHFLSPVYAPDLSALERVIVAHGAASARMQQIGRALRPKAPYVVVEYEPPTPGARAVAHLRSRKGERY